MFLTASFDPSCVTGPIRVRNAELWVQFLTTASPIFFKKKKIKLPLLTDRHWIRNTMMTLVSNFCTSPEAQRLPCLGLIAEAAGKQKIKSRSVLQVNGGPSEKMKMTRKDTQTLRQRSAEVLF